jgi:hypothetical protein
MANFLKKNSNGTFHFKNEKIQFFPFKFQNESFQFFISIFHGIFENFSFPFGGMANFQISI